MNTKTQRAAALVALVAASMTLGVMAPAAADPASDGFWYFDIYDVQAAHDAGLTGSGVTIVVIDSQINLEVPTLQGADIVVQESACYEKDGSLIPAESTELGAEHGTNIVSLLVGSGAGYPGQTGLKGIVPDATIIYTNAGRGTAESTRVCEGPTPDDLSLAVTNGIYAAIDADADIISASIQGTPDSPQIVALTAALNKGIVVISAVSNDIMTQQSGLFPGNANGVVSVQSMDANLTLQGDTAESQLDDRVGYGTDVVAAGVDLVWQGDTTWEEQRYSSGTSLATPVVAGLLGLVAQKYPDATGNQLIQTLIHNTGRDDHELEYDAADEYGYGVVSLTHLLRVDPTQYEDVNPLVSDDPEQLITREMIANPPTLAEYDPLYAEKDEWENRTPPGLGGLEIPILPIVLIGLGLLLVIGIVVLIVVVAARRARARA